MTNKEIFDGTMKMQRLMNKRLQEVIEKGMKKRKVNDFFDFINSLGRV